MTLAQDTTKSAKQLAQDIAKKIAREPLEILKNAGDQMVEGRQGHQEAGPLNEAASVDVEQQKHEEQQKELWDKMKSSRMMEALNRELSDIQKSSLFSDLQKRIAEGEEVPLEDFQGLTFEQKDVLKAQMEAVKQQMLNAKHANDKSASLFGSSKPGRRFGQKQAAEREKTHVEKPVPPSG